MRTLGILLSLALAAEPAAPALAKEPEPLKRTGKWVMDYAEGACHLSAAFGTGEDQVIAKFSQTALGDAPRLNLYGKRLYNGEAPRLRVQVTFLPASGPTPWREATNGTIQLASGKLPIVFVGGVRLDNQPLGEPGQAPLAPVTPDAEKAVNALSFRSSGKAITLDLETMGPPMAAMRKCLDNLIQHWGFDRAELATRQSRARPISNPARWVGTNDYPASMTVNGASAFVSFRATVDANGSVTACDVLETTKPPEIGPHTCDLIKKRAKFAPSIDKDGKPAPDFYINRVYWRAAD